MSRIRSVHPGLWTDERFASVSMAARLLFIGVWNEADDHGIFEWSPLKLKMRLLPADAVDAAALLNELADAGMVLPFEAGGRRLGAVRNFSRYQRPKKPTFTYPAPEPALAFATSGSAPVPDQFPTGPENSPQKEEEGGRMEEEGSETKASGASAPVATANPIDLRAAVFDSGVPLLMAGGATERGARSMLGRWRQEYGDGAVLDALAAAKAEHASDPIPFINRTLETRNGNQPRSSSRRQSGGGVGSPADAYLAAFHAVGVEG